MFRLIALLIILMLGGCLTDSPDISDDTTESQSDEWTPVASGLETDLIREDAVLFQAVRIDPTQYEFRAHYRESDPLTIQEWRVELSNAVAIINANFFDSDYRVLGLLISDSVTFGSPYRERGGTFWVSVNGNISINRNRDINGTPPNATQAVQAFPMLVQDSVPIYNNTNDTAISRRTVIAQDNEGRIIMMVTAGFGLSLFDLSQYLADSELKIVNALNLDGGGSTMMYVAPSETTVSSLDPVPAVLAVYPKTN